MPRIAVILAALLCVSITHGADDALPVPILPLFKEKDRVEYEATNWRTGTGGAAAPGKVRWRFALEVVSYKGDRLELRYTSGQRAYEEEGKPPVNLGPGVVSSDVPMEIKVLSAFTDVPLDFVIAMDTLEVTMPKYNQARARLSKVLEVVAAADPAFRGDLVGQKRLLENMEREYTKPMVIAQLTRDFLPLLRPYGHELQPGKPVDAKLTLPSPFGGAASAEAAGKLVLQPLKDKTHELRYDLKFDLAAVTALLADMITRKTGKSGAEAAREAEKVNMIMAAQVAYQYDPRSGWMTQADQTLTWTIEKRTANDFRSWRPAPPKKEEKKDAEEK